MATLNLGILAHVDAGKTSLTERILFETGVIAEIGSVDHGTTRTDTLSLERQRGITIQSAVASFTLADLTVNLIDTPGHPDFIAEVDRALRVLDAVVVVISAVAGVQPQTRRLVQAVKAAGIPFLIFVNKIDCLGARGLPLLPEVARGLDLSLVAMSVPSRLETPAATVSPYTFADQTFAKDLVDALAEVDDAIVARYIDLDGRVPTWELELGLKRAVAAGRIVPALFGSAITGAGVGYLLAELPRLLSVPEACPRAPLSAIVFKAQRTPAGEKVALVRIFAGTLAVRDQVDILRARPDGGWDEHEARVTGLERFADGATAPVGVIAAGDIGRVHGFRDVLIGDVVGVAPAERNRSHLPRPTLESIIRPRPAAAAGAMYAALRQLEEQDPLISIRRGARESTVSVRLYGEVQKEVIEATLRDEFNLEVEFDESQPICIERVIGTGAAREAIGDPGNPFLATVGFRIEPGDPESGIRYQRELGALPLAFYRAIEETVHATLEEGLLGWPVRACAVTLTAVGMTPTTAAGDFRKLVPLVLMGALREADTRVCEPIERFTVEVPAAVLGDTYARLIAAGADLAETSQRGERSRVAGSLPSSAVDRFERQLPDLTSGSGVFSSQAAGYRPVSRNPPIRPRTDFDPLHRRRYLAAVSQS
ncbi:MAG: TetM/TetW/TetO/TetS family tetracycline resistance ribosomal protection protein [Chloroflexota bacterium]|nr:TetM/TetW/TetO/TetS family tetracycline resistance ribosomal protection protein [Chloroflexota bacterium]